MWHQLWSGFEDLIGSSDDELATLEMVLRVAVVYAGAIVLVRLGEKRFMGRNTALDMILAVVLGSVLSRAITGNSPFVPTVAAAGMLVALHALLAILAFRWSRFGQLVKGRERVLIEDGQIDWAEMRKSRITRHDLERALYANGRVTDAKEVRIARLERNGDISVVPREKPREPRVLEVTVKEGVQTVRIELG